MGEHRIDLNLINVFYAIMIERSVTKAGQRLSMSQPAVSNALRRLRFLFQDELFIKVPGGIEPTDKALNVWPDLQEGLERIKSVSLPLQFEPSQTTQVFNVAVADTLASRIVPAISQRFVVAAPNARLYFQLHSPDKSIDGLEKGKLDCAVGMFVEMPQGLLCETILKDEYVCVMRRNHPLSRIPLTLEAFAAAKHVLLKQPGRDIGVVDYWLLENTCQRDIVLVVNSAMDALEIVRTTNLLIALPRSFVEALRNANDFVVSRIPVEHPQIDYNLTWHERSKRDPGRVWLRSLIKSIVESHTEMRLSSPQSPALRLKLDSANSCHA
ncbi:LysR family transcriptional regulator [Agrobacterium sp. T29]|uniref:LysR family transcriptional regulator n=1 Tax=Agrobacterium sp. T29 TaxID=2580515 RepID=UPI00115D03FC|nr:LysR family transcriptional regulator [Agrobacterium sp. T29]